MNRRIPWINVLCLIVSSGMLAWVYSWSGVRGRALCLAINTFAVLCNAGCAAAVLIRGGRSR